MAGGGGEEDLNLVPFIDLFSVLICFLLMTAVWMNVDALSTNTSLVTAAEDDEPPPEEKPDQLAVTVMANEIQMVVNGQVTRLPLVIDKEGRANVDQVLAVLAEWKRMFPDKKDIQLNTENSVMYQTMISVFDALMGSGWTDVGVNTQ
ncbi:MAG: biopolymer transporter ExbD [Bdellovibrionales bacterium]|nr:biopolymer transporter ExbD [Bdellovibrionales bacterium]